MPRTSLIVAVPLTAMVVVASGCGSSSHSASPTVPSSGTLPHGTVATIPVPSTTGQTAPAGGGSATTEPGNASTTAGSGTGSGGGTGSGTGSGQSGTATPSTVVTVPGSGTYVLSAAANQGPGPCVTKGLPGGHVPFTVSVSNHGTATEPLARVAVAITDPNESTPPPVAALSYSGICLNFTEPGGTLAPGQTVTYDGSATGISPAAVLNVTIISTPANDTLGQVSVPLH